MKAFILVMEHDNGMLRIKTTASDVRVAIEKVLNFECAPLRAIQKIYELPLSSFRMDYDSLVNGNLLNPINF